MISDLKDVQLYNLLNDIYYEDFELRNHIGFDYHFTLGLELECGGISFFDAVKLVKRKYGDDYQICMAGINSTNDTEIYHKTYDYDNNTMYQKFLI